MDTLPWLSDRNGDLKNAFRVAGRRGAGKARRPEALATADLSMIALRNSAERGRLPAVRTQPVNGRAVRTG